MKALKGADKAQYEQLISWAADHVPHTVCGKPSADQLPRLSPEDISLITRCSAIDVADQLDIAEHLEQFAADIVAKDACQLGVRMVTLLETACRNAIAYDVMCELEERERQEQIDRDHHEWAHRAGVLG